MSTYQDSMDTDDSIPQPEYEDIVADDDDDIDDDEEFWVPKPKATPIENGTQRTDTASSQPAVTSAPALPSAAAPVPVPVSASTTKTPSNEANVRSKHSDQAMDEGSDYDEISYDEADENLDDDEDISDKSVKQLTPSIVPPSANTIRAQEHSKPAAATIAAVTVPQSNKVILLTLVNKNGHPIIAKPATATSQHNSTVSLKEEVNSPTEENKSIAVSKDEQPRSNTPSNRGNREFLALKKSFTESKVLAEFVNEKDRSRKTRKLPLKSEDSMSANDGERENFRICRARSKSCSKTTVRTAPMLNNSVPQKWPSDEKLNSKRENMRSQNTDFVEKQMKFLNRVNHEQAVEEVLSDASDGEQSLNDSNKTDPMENKDDCWQPPPKKGADSFCWKCRKCAGLIPCSKCPRSYHYKCIKVSTSMKMDRTWNCPECINLENCITGSKKAKKDVLSTDMLNQLLMFALKRMKQVKGHEKLLDVPNASECPLYARYVVNPVTLNSIQEKLERKAFRCTEEFVLETKWIQHNVSIAYAAYSSKDGLVAKTLLKVCRQEAAEIETCSECYLNANTRKDWFVDVCLKPHILLWAKLKGFPYWPAKGMGQGPNSLVNVRFFGAHDRSFVPVKDCFLYSEVDPNPHSGKRAFRPSIAGCIKEVNVHIQKIKGKVGAFNFAPARTQYDPNNEAGQLEQMMPGVTEYIKRQQALQKPPLTYKIVKTADNNLSIIKKPDSGTDSDHSMLEAEKNQRNARVSGEILKASPLGQVKKTREASNDGQGTQSKPHTVLKPMAINYEVVAKPPNKDESNSSKINSVILKRKSDVMLVSSGVKKSKSSEDASTTVEYTHRNNLAASSSPSKQEVKIEDAKEGEVPAKRTRCSRSGDRGSTGQLALPSPVPVFHTAAQCEMQKKPPQAQQLQSKQSEHTKQPQPQPAKQPQEAQQATKQLQPKSDVASTSQMAAESGHAMAKFMQIRQGVTIRKISKKQSGITTYFATGDKETELKTDEKTDTAVERPKSTPKQTKAIPLAASPPKAIPLPAPPPKPIQTSPKLVPILPKPGPILPKPVAILPKPIPSPPKPADTSTPSPKPKSNNPPTRAPSSSKPKVSGLVKHRLTHPKGLIPFEDIKLENPDSEEILIEESSSSAGKAVDPLATTTTGSKTASTTACAKSVTEGSTPSAIDPDIDPDLVKQETISDDDSSLISVPSQENSTAIPVSQSSTKTSEQPTILGDTMIQRIVVRSLESLQPAKSCNAPIIPSNTAPVASTAQPPKKPNARARKSFPNKGPNASTVVLPPDVKRSLTKNSMVYIPVDSQNNAVPIQPLTAVSKVVNHNQSLAKVTTTTTIPTLSAAQTYTSTPVVSNSFVTTTSCPAIQPSSSSTALQYTPSIQDSIDSFRDYLNSSAFHSLAGSAVITGTGYITSLNTLSPLQLSADKTPVSTEKPASTVPEATTSEMSESNREGEGHILSGIVTPSLAAAITDSLVCGMPKLSYRPKGALRSDGNLGYNSDAGPVTRTLVANAHKITDFFISVMQDTISDIASDAVLQAKISELQLELEAKTCAYEKQLYEIKVSTDRMICAMRNSMEAERTRIIAETRRQCEVERIHAVEQIKKKLWCMNCGREANSYCCWNTAYCEVNCQRLDWLRHKEECKQFRQSSNADQQGTGAAISGPPSIFAGSTVSTTAHSKATCSTPGFVPFHSAVFRPACQSTNQTPVSLSSGVPTSSQALVSTAILASSSSSAAAATTATIATTQQQKGGSPALATTTSTSTTPDLTYKSPEMLKLPPNTFLRPLRLAAPFVHRFNIPLPIAATSATGGPPYKLVQRDNNWELMGTTIPTTTVVSSAQSPFQQTTRLINAVAANLQDSRAHGSIMIRPNQM